MSGNDFYDVIITNLREKTHSTFYRKSNPNVEVLGTSTSYKSLTGDMYFEKKLIRNEKTKHNYTEGLLVGTVDFLLDQDDDYDSIIYVNKNHIIYNHTIQNVGLRVNCDDDLFENLRRASVNKLEVIFRFYPNEWKSVDNGDSYTSYCKIDRIDIFKTKYNLEFYENKRVRHIENYLLTELCGGRTDGQIPTICKEISKAFSKQSIFNNRELLKELLEKVIGLISSIRYDIFNERTYADKSSLRQEIESSDDMDLCKIFELYGDNFYEQLEKIVDTKKKNDLLVEYNTFWKRVDAVKMFEDGYVWNHGVNFPSIAEEYLKIPFINSPTLNTILVDGLIAKDIDKVAGRFQYNKIMTSEAFLSLSSGVYLKSDITAKNKSITEVLLWALAGPFIWLVAMFFSGLFTWWLTSIFAGDNELGHCILFSSLFSASIIVTALNRNKAIKENREEFNFYILRDMCHLHKQAEYMNSDLLINLMYKIEERGIVLSNYVYDILKRT